MEYQGKLYVGAIPVLLALAWVFLGPKLEDVSQTLSVSDADPTQGTPPKGHLRPFGYHADEEKGIVELDEFPDPETFYRDYMRKSVPLIVRGGVKHWPAVERWKSEDYLREKFGHQVFNVMFKNTSVDKNHFGHMFMYMDDYLNHYKNHKLYLDAGISLEMAEDVTLPKVFGCDTYFKIMKPYQIFFNAGWSSTDLHLDITETFFAQVTGQRQWILTTPRDGKNTYSDDFQYHTGISQIDIESVDLINFPDVTKVDVYNITANPGDIIYVPEGWWHQVRAKGPNPPNIAIAIFLHWLNCQYEVPPGTDAEYVEGCIKIREEKPLEMTCGMKVDEAPMSELKETLKHMELDVFTSISEDASEIMEELEIQTSLLKSGYEMPDLGLALGDIPDSELEAALEYALKTGYRLFDPDLSEESESILGSVLASNKHCKREDAFVIVKVPQDSLGKDATRKSVENSMKRFQTDYLDLVLLQVPSCNPKDEECWELLKESWQTLEEMNATGSIRSLGVMDIKIKNLRDLIKIAKVPISVVHSRFDLMKRRTKLRQLCNDNGIRFMAHSLMGEKWLTEDGQNPILTSNDLRVVSATSRATTQAVLIRWALDQNVTVVPRALNPFYISLNQRALMVDISEFEDTFENFPHAD
ncbi:uncharacterized protein LOC106150561 isoform X1 [Lingula anatina]|uniref:Uncharacterized protein LOC106150561 isoform X1 n=1 Tax=Lingula anatina TaxID=7574 RepID=A0A1S3GYZ2_LINAN|nr:uncharacterized protein LOC106150561 isoform X1 [Lingula anatina]|eukprot:XP_013378892.1 uncharacterized protein LOC106150561 isoform X1 [Lingula anatina]